MTAPTPEMLEARKWCIETALGACENPMDAPALAAALVAVIEGAPEPPRPLDFSRMMVGDRQPDPPADDPDASNEVAIVKPPPPAAPEPQLVDLPPRSIPRMDATPLPDGPDLSDRDVAVLDAIHLLLPDGGWPSYAAISEESEVPYGSLGQVMERLLKKGYLARPDGKWAVVERAAG